MKSETPPRANSGRAIAASCFLIGLVALLAWRLEVWQSASNSRARVAAKRVAAERGVAKTPLVASGPEHQLSDGSRGLVPSSRVEPAVWHPPAEGPHPPAPETREPQGASPHADVDALDALVISDPEHALAYARDALARDPDSSLAPRYARSLVKALTGLGRFHEARDEARRIVERYRGTPEALDVERHLLVYPLDQPSREQMQSEASRGMRR